MSVRGFLAKFLLLLVVVGFVIPMLLEGGARTFASALNLSPYMQYDELLGWTARPGAVKVHRVDGVDVTYRINEQGLRGTAYTQKKPANTRRLVVLGDSNGFGWGVADDQIFAEILDRELPNVEVINLSVSGYGTDQEYLRFVREGIAFEPDVVILQVTPNDFDEIQYSYYSQKPKPHFLFTSSGLRLSNVPPKVGDAAAHWSYRYTIPLPFNEWLVWNSYAFAGLNEQYYLVRRRYAPRRTGDDLNRPRFSPDSFRLFNAIADRLSQKIDEIGARGLMVYAAQELNERQSSLTSRLPIVDLHPAFVAHPKHASQGLWLKDGYHFSSAGHRLVADGLMHALKNRALLTGL